MIHRRKGMGIMMVSHKDRESIRDMILSSGAVAVGFAVAEDVGESVISQYQGWIEGGNHAGMDYLARHASLKGNPSHVLEGATTVISVAFSYAPPEFRDTTLPVIACYAYGSDYHDVLRTRLSPIVEILRDKFGGEWRICIDSAPLAERYWAMRSGIGVRGDNGTVIVEGAGAYAFLAEIVTTIPLPPDKPSTLECKKCGACHKACPQKALLPDGTVDSRRCLNYLTIEHRGDWDEGYADMAHTPAARHTLYGCDICLRVCPLNRGVPPTGIPDFQPRREVMCLTAEEAAGMTQGDFSVIFKGSPIKRAKLAGLRRNALNITGQPHSADSPDKPVTSTDS